MEFDESQAIKYMQDHVPAEIATMCTDEDELTNLIDLVYDYYEANGLLEIDMDDLEEDDVDFEDLMAYVRRMLRKDKGATLAPEAVEPLLRAYLDYEATLE
ncbi:MAG: hypothetical protein K2M19_07920 [Muribaculaceae bacterium]|nr:hypothetical protein [Muribaculaceae bacterium]